MRISPAKRISFAATDSSCDSHRWRTSCAAYRGLPAVSMCSCARTSTSGSSKAPVMDRRSASELGVIEPGQADPPAPATLEVDERRAQLGGGVGLRVAVAGDQEHGGIDEGPAEVAERGAARWARPSAGRRG